MAAPVALTDQEFDAFVGKNPVVVVDFWAEWCGPCKKMDPMIKELAEKYAGKVAFAKVNADENPVKIRSFGVMGIPTLLVFKNGKLVDRIVGATPKGLLEEKVRAQL